MAARGRSWLVSSARVLTVVLLVGGLAGCSLRQDDRPREIPRASLPNVLFEQSPTTSSQFRTELRSIYLVKNQDNNESLVSVPVPIQPPPTGTGYARTIIETLVTKPPVSNTEYSSAIPLGTRVLDVQQRDDVLEINLTNNLGTVESTRQRMAVAQIVFTATDIDGIRFVRISIDGAPSAVPLDEGTSEVGALISRADFPKLGAATATTVPTQNAPSATTTPEPTNPGSGPVGPESVQNN